MGYTGRGGTNKHVYAMVLGVQKWADPDTLIRVNESVVSEDITIPASRHWFVDELLTVDPGFTLTVSPGAKVVVHKGNLEEATATVSVATTLDTEDEVIYVDTTSADVTITLPAVAGFQGRHFEIKNVGTGGNRAIIDGDGAELVERLVTFPLSDDEALTVRADTTSWRAT